MSSDITKLRAIVASRTALENVEIVLINEGCSECALMDLVRSALAAIAAVAPARMPVTDEVTALRDELDDLRQFKAEVDAEGTVPASRVQLLDNIIEERDSLKGSLSLCTQLFESTCEAAEIDMETTQLTISIGDKPTDPVAGVAIATMLAKFKEQAK